MAKGKFAIGALVGVAAGFVTGILTAPKSGKETRQDIKEASVKAKDVAVEKATQVKDAAVNKAQQVRGKAEDVYEDVSGKAVEVKHRVENAVEGAQKGFSKNPTKK